MQISALCQPLAPVACDDRCVDVQQLFVADPELLSVAIVDDGRPVGMINRHDMLMHLSQQFGFALYGQKPASVLMDREPLVIEIDSDLSTLVSRVTLEKPSAVLQGFIVTREGRYHGIGTGLKLLQATNQQMALRTAELERARQSLELADKAKSRFLAQMSHELRTPLNAIIGFSELMQQQVFGELGDPRYAEYSADITTSGRHLLQIINEVLDMAKIESGRMELRETIIDIGPMLQRCLRLIGGLAERGGITTTLRADASLPQLCGDELKLQQAIINILSNAVRFTPHGGSVAVHAEVARHGLKIVVRDTGIGIAADKLNIVLEPFGQADNSLQRKHEGTGLGLPLAKAFAELHGGALHLDSSVGEGTAVTITLPGHRLLNAAATGTLLIETRARA